MKITAKKLLVFFSLVIVFAPILVSAQVTATPADDPATFNTGNPSNNTGFQLVPCNAAASTDPVTGKAATPCDYNSLVTLVQRGINLLIYASTFIAVIMILYAGFIYLTASGDTSKTKKAHAVFRVTVIGMIIALCSWVIVNTVVTKLGILNPSFQNANPLQKQ